MAVLSSRRLEEVFGCRLDDISAEHVRALVASSAEEAFDLDFKATLYGNSDEPKRDLCGDVAALANTAGGVLVLGVAENKRAQAAGLPGVGLSDTEVTRMRHIIASGVAPMPEFDIRAVEDRDLDGDGAGYYLILVPASPAAPHAVLVNKGFRYPVRNGASIRWMAEPEVATAYRVRDQGAAARAVRLSEVESAAAGRLSDSTAWLLVTTMPASPGHLHIDRATFADFQRYIMGRTLTLAGGAGFLRATVNQGCLTATGGAEEREPERYVLLDLHDDGACALAVSLRDITDRSFDNPERYGVALITDEALCSGLISGLYMSATESRDRAFASGPSVARARLIPAAGTALTLGHQRDWTPELITRRRVTAAFQVEILASLDDLATAGASLISAVALLGNRLVQEFGVAEMYQVTAQGELRRRYWHPDWQNTVLTWAAANDIAVVDTVLD